MPNTTIPLTLINLNDDGFHLLVEIVVYGQKHFAVLDTGASRSVFDAGFTAKYNSSPISEHEVPADETFATTLFSTSNTALANFPQLKIGRMVLTDYTVVALDLASVNEAYSLLGHPAVVGIIGGDILFSHQAKINYETFKMTLSY